MDFDDPHQRAVFFDIHAGLPREGPGCEAATLEALRLAGLDTATPAVLDIGCGPGLQTLHLAKALPGARITAVDFHQPFLDDLARRANVAGVGQQIVTHCADMAALPFENARFDLLWSEGAAYSMGVEAALLAWQRLIRPGGRLAFSEAVWRTDDRPARAVAMWSDYPAMRDVEGNRALIARCGYRLIGDFHLPASAWLQDYYDPMAERLDLLDAKYAGDTVAEAVLGEAREEIAVFKAHGDSYGYQFFVAEPDAA